MHKLVALGKLDPTMQRIATWIRLQVPQDRRASTTAVCDAIFWWVKKHGIFQRDPFQIEKIEHPIAAMQPIIEARAAGTYKGPGLFVGDCDTIAGVYTATLLGVLGFHYAWETAKVDPTRPDEFSHVWVAARTDGDWYALDPSTKDAKPGWRPPVSPNLFARWPEKPIEEAIGMSGMNGMNGMNGHGRGLNGHGMGEDNGDVYEPDNGFFPEDEYGYGIPKRIGGPGPGILPRSDAANMQLLPPYDTQIPEADLQPGLKYIKAAKGQNPSDRVRHLVGQPDDHGPPYYRGRNAGRQAYINKHSMMYSPGAPWNGNYGIDVRKYQKSGEPYVQSQNPGSPERQVKIVMEQPMALRRRQTMVVTRPYLVPEGMSGMGDDPLAGAVFSLDDPQTPPEEASKGVWSTITDVIKTTVSSGAQVLAAKYAKAVSRATNAVVGSPVTTPGSYTAPRPSSWLSSPWVWVGGALVVGGAAYALTSGGGKRRRR
jgi:hypothetical protein